jgi:hypothetical protein
MAAQCWLASEKSSTANSDIHAQLSGFFVISLKNDTTGRIDLFRFLRILQTFRTFCEHVRVAVHGTWNRSKGELSGDVDFLQHALGK